MGRTAVLIIDRNDARRSALARTLATRGVLCLAAISARDGLDIVATRAVDVIVVGGEAAGDTLPAVRLLRVRGVVAPVVVCSSTAIVQDEVVVALDAGADDVLGAVADHFNELRARIYALKRRAAGGAGLASRRIGDVEVDATTQRILIGGQPFDLSREQFRIVAYMAAVQRVVSHDEVDRVMGYDVVASKSTQRHRVVQAMRRLRKRLGAEAIRLRTVANVGYELHAQSKR